MLSIHCPDCDNKITDGEYEALCNICARRKVYPDDCGHDPEDCGFICSECQTQKLYKNSYFQEVE